MSWINFMAGGVSLAWSLDAAFKGQVLFSIAHFSAAMLNIVLGFHYEERRRARRSL